MAPALWSVRLSFFCFKFSQICSHLYLQFLSTAASVVGTIALVFYTFPLLGTIFAPMVVIYSSAFLYYRRTSVETKRLEAILRSILYASYSGAVSPTEMMQTSETGLETLTGLSTIRAYREQVRS